MSNYLTKMAMQWSLGDELTGGQTKQAKGTGRTPTEVLQDYHRTGNRVDGELFQAWYSASFRTKLLTWSNGLKDIFAVPDKTDQQIAEEEIGAGTETITYGPYVWRKIISHGLRSGLLDAQEETGATGVLTLLTERGIGFCLEILENGTYQCGDP